MKFMQLFSRRPRASQIARQRLTLILSQDRLLVDDGDIKKLHHELTTVLAKYFEFTVNSVQMSLKRDGNSYVLVADFPYDRKR